MNCIITGVEISDILSFGHKQRIEKIRNFNLLIGRNGTGKSNFLRVIGSLDLMLRYNSRTIQGILGDFMHIFEANIAYEYQNEEVSQRSDHLKHHIADQHSPIGDILIEYESKGDNNINPYKGKIIFKNSKQTRGNYHQLKQSISLIDKPMSDDDFYENFLLNISNDKQYFYLLNFGFLYIFSGRLSISNRGLLFQNNTIHEDGRTKKTGGRDAYNPIKWSSGTLHCAKIIMHILTSKSILLIDEIETHLEPRTCRKLIQFIFWIASYGTEKNCLGSIDYIKNLTQLWKTIDMEKFSPYRSQDIPQDNYRLSYFNEKGIRLKQVFISTHSSVLIEEFLNLGNHASVYEFSLRLMDNSFDLKKLTRGAAIGVMPNDNKSLIIQKSLFTSIRLVSSGEYKILDNLGIKGADILQVNGIIWVEGPSDAIYINKWLEMYSSEYNLSMPRKGRDYEFYMFGGAIIDNLCLVKDDNDEENAYKKIVSMFSFSRNAFVVLDSDAILKNNEVIDISKFSRAKKFIKKQFESLSQERSGLGIWYKEGNTEIRTMECYLDTDSQTLIKRGYTKKIAAQKIISSWNEKKLDDFPYDLKSEIQTLFNTIYSWNK